MDSINLPSPSPTPFSTFHNTSFKRRNEPEDNTIHHNERSIKNITKEDQITSEAEWPQFIHPEGGLIKITPWGTLRQYVDPITQETITKFEDCSLEDYSFKLENIERIYQTPDTPQSIYNKSGGNTGTNTTTTTTTTTTTQTQILHISPGDDAEGYLLEGYRDLGPLVEILPQRSIREGGRGQGQGEGEGEGCFEPEHENYFGMNDAGHVEEFDFNHDEDEEML